jgi:hypothetical protein
LADRYASHSDTGNCRFQRGLGYIGTDFVGYGNILSKSCRPAISDAFDRTISKNEGAIRTPTDRPKTKRRYLKDTLCVYNYYCTAILIKRKFFSG